MKDIRPDLRACTLCAQRFDATATAHQPNPVVWFQPGAQLLIASQAPGMKVHRANTPFWDASGGRLRHWLGLDENAFHDRSRVAIVPMAFCFPGYDAKGSDLPPPPLCRATWHARVMGALPDLRLKVVIGGYAQRFHYGARSGVTEMVRGWRDHAPAGFPLPHPWHLKMGQMWSSPWG